PREPERDAERDPEHGRDPETEQDANEARHDVPVELRKEPHVLELDEDRRQPREVLRVGVHGPRLPEEEDRDRHRDLGGDCKRGVRSAAHVVPPRCHGCQRGTRRPGALMKRWIATPRIPVASAYAYRSTVSPNDDA